MMNASYGWYSYLIKPEWAPPAWIFGPVWTVLYIGIIISFGYVTYLFLNKRLIWRLFLPFFLNIVFNLIFTPIQFGLQNLPLATLDILLVLGTLVWALWSIRKTVPWVAYINIPYLVWVSFATVLQVTVTYLNL
jgi:translocator protein